MKKRQSTARRKSKDTSQANQLEKSSQPIQFNTYTCLSFISEHYVYTNLFRDEDIIIDWKRQYDCDLELALIQKTLNNLVAIDKLLKIRNPFPDKDKSPIEDGFQEMFETKNDNNDEKEEDTSKQTMDDSKSIYYFQLNKASEKNQSIGCVISRIKAILGTNSMTVYELSQTLDVSRQRIRLILDVLLCLGVVEEKNSKHYTWNCHQEEALLHIKTLIPQIYGQNEMFQAE